MAGLGHTDIFVGELVRQPNTLWLMLHRFAVHNRLLELFDNGLVDRVTLQHPLATPFHQ